MTICRVCGADPCYRICLNNVDYYSPEQERADDLALSGPPEIVYSGECRKRGHRGAPSNGKFDAPCDQCEAEMELRELEMELRERL